MTTAFHSRPSATKKISLYMDGVPDPSFPAPISSYTGNLLLTWLRPAINFLPLNVDVTTERYPITPRLVQVVYVADYGGGEQSETMQMSFGYGLPAIVTDRGSDPYRVGEAITHECGHAFGLNHQCAVDESNHVINPYRAGPIMGDSVGYPSQGWVNGPSAQGWTYLGEQNDLERLTTVLGAAAMNSEDVVQSIGSIIDAYRGTVQPPAPQPPTPQPSTTEIVAPNGQLTDNSGAVWSWDQTKQPAGYGVMRNGIFTNGFAMSLKPSGGKIYVVNAFGDWFVWNNGWQKTAAPN